MCDLGEGVYMGHIVNTEPTSIKLCRDNIVVINVIVSNLYININFNEQVMLFTAFFWSGICMTAMINCGPILKKFGRMI